MMMKDNDDAYVFDHGPDDGSDDVDSNNIDYVLSAYNLIL